MIATGYMQPVGKIVIQLCSQLAPRWACMDNESYKRQAGRTARHVHLFYQGIAIVCNIWDRQLKRVCIQELTLAVLICSCLFPQCSAFDYYLVQQRPQEICFPVSMTLMCILSWCSLAVPSALGHLGVWCNHHYAVLILTLCSANIIT